MKRASRLLPLPLLLLLGSGCGDQRPVELGACADPPVGPQVDETTAPAGLTYYKDAKRILDERCVRCHQDGGIGPFPLVTYEDVVRRAGLIHEAVHEGEMPPWLPADCCTEYKYDRSLSDEQALTLLGWLAQGAAMGDPADEPTDPIDTSSWGGLSRVDLVLQTPAPYTPRFDRGRDDQRCFLFQWPLDEVRYVTGMNVRPQNRRIAHHGIVFVASADDKGYFLGKEAEDPEPGWDCFGDLGDNTSGSIGGWIPGEEGQDFPDGLGKKVSPGSLLILNMHYDDPGDGVVHSDQVSIELKLDETARYKAQSVLVGNPQWLIEGGFTIPAGAEDVTYSFQYDPTPLFSRNKRMMIYDANLHMHERGSRGTIAILRKDGTTDCLLHMPRYDWGWQGRFWFAEPRILHPGDRLYVECHYDNSGPNPVTGEPPRDLTWKDTDDMCGGILMFRVMEDGE